MARPSAGFAASSWCCAAALNCSTRRALQSTAASSRASTSGNGNSPTPRCSGGWRRLKRASPALSRSSTAPIARGKRYRSQHHPAQREDCDAASGHTTPERSERSNDADRRQVRWHSIRLSRPLVAKVAVAGTLHDGLRARELYLGTESLGHRDVCATDQQESEFRLAQRLEELSVPASRNIELEGILSITLY